MENLGGSFKTEGGKYAPQPLDLSNFCWGSSFVATGLTRKKKNNNNRSDEFCCTLCQLADITVFLVGFSFYRGVRGVPPLDREKTICEFPSQPGDTHSIAPLLIVWMTKELRRFIAISRVKPSLLTMLFGTPRGQWLSCEMMINQE